MKNSRLSTHFVPFNVPTPDLLDEWEDFKDVWYPSGEISMYRETKEALQTAGYRIEEAVASESRSAWLFHLVRPKSLSRVRFIPHLRNLLWPIGPQFCDEEISVQRIGRHLIVLMFWPKAPGAEDRMAAGDEQRLQELLDKLP